MPRSDPYRPKRPFEYECPQCGARVRADQGPGRCERCSGTMQDVSVARE